MKLESAFKNFLEKTVNLNQTRYDMAVAAQETMRKLLKNNSIFGDKFIDLRPQGSFRQETIIKPVDEDAEFDVDLLFEMKEVDGWDPASYLKKLADEIRKLERYKDLVDTHGKTRCVTIDYESDFHIDLVPSITLNDGRQMVMNKTVNTFEVTDGDGYAQWFEDRSKITGNKYLIKTVRLIKYIRDAEGAFEVKSVLLTTLLGNLVSSTDIQSRDYPDLPTAFLILITRLDEYLQANPTMRPVANPVLPSEHFNRHWDQEKYHVFRDKIHLYAQLTKEAYIEPDEIKSLKIWQKIFGDNFVIPSDDEDSVITQEESTVIILGDYSHRQLPQWPRSLQGAVEIKKCHVSGKMNLDITSNAWPIPSGCSLNYFAEVTGISGPYEVWWQVVNTGDHARDENCLRGNFESPKDPSKPLQQKESSGYTGKHWIQCFIVKNGQLVAESKPFFLNVVNKKRNKFRRR